MADILQFPARRVVTHVEPSKYDTGPTRPVHGGYPAPPPVSHTAAQQVLEALQFYARSGFDHGELARKALIAMQTTVEANNTPTQEGQPA
jgi:hypothetical protein